MIPNGTRVRVKNKYLVPSLLGIDGLKGRIVESRTMYGATYYVVEVNGTNYDLAPAEIEVIK